MSSGRRWPALLLLLALHLWREAQGERLELGVWTFRALNNASVPVVKQATVPGSSHMHLMKAGVIEDPYLRYHELDYEWIAQETWVYETQVDLETEPQAVSGNNTSLAFEQLDGVAQISVNGKHVASTDNSFLAYKFEIGHLLQRGSNAIQVTFLPALQYVRNKAAVYPYDVPATRNFNVWVEPSHRSFIRKAGSDFGWDWGPAFVTCGITGSAYLELASSDPSSEPLVLENVNIEQTFPNGNGDLSSVDLAVQVAISPPKTRYENVKLHLFVDNQLHMTRTTTIELGDDALELGTTIKNPILWWPNGHGKAHLYLLRVEVVTASSNAAREHKFGIRTVELIEEETTAGGVSGGTFYFKINNVAMFMKGANWIPVDSFPTRVTRAKTTHLLRSAQAANMNMVRVWGGGRYESDAFYEECDRLGLLVWQELMFACGMYPRDQAFLDSVKSEVEFQVKRLRKYTSIAIWGANNENENMMQEFGGSDPKFNRDIAVTDFTTLFVDLIRPIVLSLDSGRPFVDTSPSNGLFSRDPYVKRWGHTNDIAYGDVHYYNYDGDCQDPSMYPHARFISEFGFQSAPSKESLLEVTNHLDWSSFNSFWRMLKFRERHENGNAQMLRQMERRFLVPFPFRDEEWLAIPFNEQDEFGFDIAERIGSYLYLTQIQQGLCYQTAIRAWRRGKNLDLGMTMGILYWQLNDIWQGTSWSSTEFSGKWKSLHYVVKREYAPVILSIDVSHARSLRIYGVSDVNNPVKLEIEYEVRKTKCGSLVKTIQPKTYALQPLESKLVKTLDVKDLLDTDSTGCSSKSCFLYARCVATLPDTSLPCEDVYHVFAPFKNLQLGRGSITVSSVAQVTSSASDEIEELRFNVQIQSTDFVALFVELDVPNVRGFWDLNSFMMLANDTKVIQFTQLREPNVEALTVEQLKQTVSVNWLQKIYESTSSYYLRGMK